MSIRYESVENLLTLIKDKKSNHLMLLKIYMMQLKRLIQQLKSFLALDKENAIKKRKNWMNYKQKTKWMANYLVFQWV